MGIMSRHLVRARIQLSPAFNEGDRQEEKKLLWDKRRRFEGHLGQRQGRNKAGMKRLWRGVCFCMRATHARVNLKGLKYMFLALATTTTSQPVGSPCEQHSAS